MCSIRIRETHRCCNVFLMHTHTHKHTHTHMHRHTHRHTHTKAQAQAQAHERTHACISKPQSLGFNLWRERVPVQSQALCAFVRGIYVVTAMVPAKLLRPTILLLFAAAWLGHAWPDQGRCADYLLPTTYSPTINYLLLVQCRKKCSESVGTGAVTWTVRHSCLMTVHTESRRRRQRRRRRRWWRRRRWR